MVWVITRRRWVSSERRRSSCSSSDKTWRWLGKTWQTLAWHLIVQRCFLGLILKRHIPLKSYAKELNKLIIAYFYAAMRFKIVFIETILWMSSIDSTIQYSLCVSYHLILQQYNFAVVYYISILSHHRYSTGSWQHYYKGDTAIISSYIDNIIDDIAMQEATA